MPEPEEATPDVIRSSQPEHKQEVIKVIAFYARLGQRVHGYNQRLKERIEEAQAS